MRKRTAVEPTAPKQPEKPQLEEEKAKTKNVEQFTPVTFEQKEAALCLIAFFAGYNDDLTTDGSAYMVSYQSAIFFGIGNYKETLTAALPKYQDADKLIKSISHMDFLKMLKDCKEEKSLRKLRRVLSKI